MLDKLHPSLLRGLLTPPPHFPAFFFHLWLLSFPLPQPVPFGHQWTWSLIGRSLPWELACKTPMLSSNCIDLMLSDAKMHSLSCSEASSILFWLADSITHMSQRLMLTALKSARLNGVPFRVRRTERRRKTQREGERKSKTQRTDRHRGEKNKFKKWAEWSFGKLVNKSSCFEAMTFHWSDWALQNQRHGLI